MKLIDLLEYNLNNSQLSFYVDMKCNIIVSMPPELFLELTTASDLEYIKQKTQTKEFYQDLMDKGDITVPPFLSISRTSGKIMSHEGRSRALSALNAGNKQFQVGIQLYPSTRNASLKDIPALWVAQFKNKTFSFEEGNVKSIYGSVTVLDSNVQRQYNDIKESDFSEGIALGDSIGFSFSEDFEIGTEIVGLTEDGFIVELDEYALEYLESHGVSFIDEGLREPEDNPCWKGYRPIGTKKKNGKIVPNCVPSIKETEYEIEEAEYHGRKVPLNKKLPGDVKKSKVYVRKPNGKVVKVNFGDKNMRIRKSNPKRRKSFRARHNCKNPGPRWKARYWSCKSW